MTQYVPTQEITRVNAYGHTETRIWCWDAPVYCHGHGCGCNGHWWSANFEAAKEKHPHGSEEWTSGPKYGAVVSH